MNIELNVLTIVILLVAVLTAVTLIPSLEILGQVVAYKLAAIIVPIAVGG